MSVCLYLSSLHSSTSNDTFSWKINQQALPFSASRVALKEISFFNPISTFRNGIDDILNFTMYSDQLPITVNINFGDFEADIFFLLNILNQSINTKIDEANYTNPSNYYNPFVVVNNCQFQLQNVNFTSFFFLNDSTSLVHFGVISDIIYTSFTLPPVNLIGSHYIDVMWNENPVTQFSSTQNYNTLVRLHLNQSTFNSQIYYEPNILNWISLSNINTLNSFHITLLDDQMRLISIPKNQSISLVLILQ